MKALLVIDMQRGVFAATPRRNETAVVQHINQLSASFRQNGFPVIFVRHDGTAENWLFPETDEWQILASLVCAETDLFIGKTANDAFYRTDLQEKLQALGIDELCICGCATDFCVNATVQAALVRDYNIIIPQDAHTTADRPGIGAREIVTYFNWLWSSLTPTRGSIRVEPVQAIIDSFCPANSKLKETL
jgi:nicotinamidase-related amidase